MGRDEVRHPVTLLALLAATGTSTPPPDPTLTWTARRQVSDRASTMTGGAGTWAPGASSVRVRQIIRHDCKDLRIAFTGAETAWEIQSAALEIGSTLYPLTFSGSRAGSVPLGGHLTADTLALTVTAGTEVWVRYSPHGADVGGSRGFAQGGISWQNVSGNLVDTLSWSGLPGTGLVVCPPAEISALTHPNNVAILALGDSITEGGNDTAGGWFARGTAAAGLPALNASKWLQQMSTIMDGAGAWTATALSQRGPTGLSAFTHVVCAHGTNDMNYNDLAGMQAKYTDLWEALAGAGLTVAVRTIPPRTSSTDDWATLANQTVTAAEPVRLATNAWLRTEPGGVVCIDSAAQVEHGGAESPSGKWRVDAGSIAGDGGHPGAAGHALMAAPFTAWLNTL